MIDPLQSDEVKTAAIAAGMFDIRDLALSDPSQLRADAAGKVTNALEFVTGLRASKPHLFKRARDMTPAEYEAGLRAIRYADRRRTFAPPTAPAKHAKDMTPEEFSAGLQKLRRQTRG